MARSGIAGGKGVPGHRDDPPDRLRLAGVRLRVSLEDIADLRGHASTKVPETVYRHRLRPVPLQGADAMDATFGAEDVWPLRKQKTTSV